MLQASETALIESVRALNPLIREHALAAERQRKPVDEVMAAIEATGVYRWFVPKRFGGYEYSLEGFVELGMSMGEACAAHAWVVTFCMEHNWLLALYDEPAQADLFGKHPYIIAPGSLAPNGQAAPVDGGYRVKGRWQWGTGVMHANYVMVGALVPTENKPRFGMFVIPREEVEVVDTWHVAGMVGTGSNDIVVEDVFVPGHRMVELGQLRDGTSPGSRVNPAPLYRIPMLPLLGLTALSPLVGAAKNAVSLFADRLKGRTVYGTLSQQSERAPAQIRLARGSVELAAIVDRVRALAREVEAWGRDPEPCPEIERARIRVEIAALMRRTRDLVRDVVEASGASAQFLDNPLQRALRDVDTASCHTVFDMDVAGENYGRLLLGLEPSSPV